MKIAIIPARGGSKRIPRKNIKLFHGKPLIAYSIEAAIKSGIFDRIIVSTDDLEIAKVAKEYGAEIPFLRPENISDDYATTAAVISHALNWFQAKEITVDYSCCIYATAPFIRCEDIIGSFKKLIKSKASYCFSVASFPAPIQRAFMISSDGRIQMNQPEHLETRSQDLEDMHHDAGQFYWSCGNAWSENPFLFSEISTPWILPRHLVQDIDTPEDWSHAEHMYTALKLSGE